MRSMFRLVKTESVAHLLSPILLIASLSNTSELMWAQEQQPMISAASSSYTGQGAPFTVQELQSLVAPIALYPDALVAQVLNAATFSDQIAVANYWLSQNKNLSGSAACRWGQGREKQQGSRSAASISDRSSYQLQSPSTLLSHWVPFTM